MSNPNPNNEHDDLSASELRDLVTSLENNREGLKNSLREARESLDDCRQLIYFKGRELLRLDLERSQLRSDLEGERERHRATADAHLHAIAERDKAREAFALSGDANQVALENALNAARDERNQLRAALEKLLTYAPSWLEAWAEKYYPEDEFTEPAMIYVDGAEAIRLGRCALGEPE